MKMSESSQEAVDNALSRVMSELGIYTIGPTEDTKQMYMGKVTKPDLEVFEQRIIDNKQEVETVWRDVMNPIKIAGGYKRGSDRRKFNNPDLDMRKLVKLVDNMSKAHGLKSPMLNEVIINESRWQKLAGII
jgi:hypothetical protein